MAAVMERAGSFSPSTEFLVAGEDAEVRARAVRCVAAHARDAADAELLLDVLGLSASEAAS
ncbi:MAG TPA: hypothetical protein VN738_05090 [Acidothermaceae bacterium]|nr:hypothetical protein [Acidothermaceae bacterium]